MNNRYEPYALAATSLQNHLKHLWERLENKVEYLNFLLLRGDIKTYDETDKTGDSLIKNLVSKVQRLLPSGRVFDEETVFVDNSFADLFEEYFSLLKAWKTESEDTTSTPAAALERLYVLIANARALIKKTKAFLETLEQPIVLNESSRIQDDRIELTLHSVQELLGTSVAPERRSLKKWLFLRFFGRPCFYLGVFFLVLLIGLIVAEAFGRAMQAQDLQYLKQESAEAFNEALKNMPSPVLGTTLGAVLYVLSSQATWICLLCSFLYWMIGKKVFRALLKRQNKSADLKFLLAWGYIDYGLFPFAPSMEQHKILMLEAAEEGCDEAYLRLGVMYEKGLFDSKKEPMSEADRLDNALRCYKNAFPNAAAIEKYNLAKEKRENLQ